MTENPVHQAHDALFRAAFADPVRAAELLRTAAPRALAREIDWTSLQRIDATFVDRELRQQQADLLFAARVAERDVLIYLLLEHKAEPDRWTAFQLLQYVVRIWQKFRREHPHTPLLPPVVPFVLHHGQRTWGAPRHLRDLIDVAGGARALRDLQPQLRFVLDDLAASSPDDLHHRRLAAATLLPLLHLQQIRREVGTAMLLRRWRALHLRLMATPSGRALLEQLISYVAAVSDDEPDALRRAYRSIHVTNEETYMTVAQKLIAEGLQKGRQQGLEEGMQVGRAMLRAQLLQRFGDLPADDEARLRTAAPADLDRWAQRVLTARTLDQVFAP